ncbi:T9SS type A sorting domain-containing protein [Mesonia aestuariivivens]|uniref:T9SS type A sorting domain-containing protein n=1 Tax=Mesonia aestuariivivens TaxID=2796128 RepID=A0ABS6W5G3_9FLAO|nr:T9SS type A sorting domain-containing protein [Mesonia aestuariivivens]MBW2963105.1 T9SS type A sorting domain-containing protein [Mesonia aestuariivivens]
MKKIIYLTFLITALSNAQSQIGNIINGIGVYEQFGPIVTISNDGTKIAVGSWASNVQGSESGQVDIYELNNNTWTQLGNSINGSSANDNFGISISLSENGNIIAIGAPNYNGNLNDIGQVKIYALNNGQWSQLGNTLQGTESNHFFGASVSLSNNGNTLAIGAPGFGNDDSGQINVYSFSAGNWNLLGNSINGDNNDNFFGQVVELSGDGNSIAITDFNYEQISSKLGKVKVYYLNNNSWSQKGSTIFNDLGDNNLSNSISLNHTGEKLVIGIPGNDDNGTDSGKAQSYIFQNNDWSQVGADINGTSNSNLGYRVNNNDNVLTISSINFNSIGKVDIYDTNGSNLNLLNTIFGASNNSFYGFSTSLSSNNIITLSTQSDNNLGQIETYDLSGLLNVKHSEFSKVKVYPNPTSNILYLDLSKNSKIENINIISINGKRIKQLSNNLNYIDVSSLSQGMYFIEIVSDNSNYISKFVKK